jgi:hypothetical protein
LSPARANQTRVNLSGAWYCARIFAIEWRKSIGWSTPDEATEQGAQRLIIAIHPQLVECVFGEERRVAEGNVLRRQLCLPHGCLDWCQGIEIACAITPEQGARKAFRIFLGGTPEAQRPEDHVA